MTANTASATKKPGLHLGRLSAVAQIAVQKPTQAPDAEIDLTRLYSVKQVRQNFRNLEELAESIKLNGIIEPLVVHEEADDRYRIIVGERRFRAALLAGLTKVPVIIKRGLTELQIRRLQVTENNDRDDLTAYEEAMGVIEDVERYGTKEAMLIWNRGEAWISKRVAVKRYADPVRELLKNELCGDFEVLHCLNQIYEVEPSHAEFNRMRHRLDEGLPLSRDEARNTLARMKAWKQQQEEFEQRRREAARREHAGADEARDDEAADEAAEGGAGDPVTTDTSATRGQTFLPTMGPTPEERAAAERQRAADRLLSLREEVFEWGEANEDQFKSMKTHMATLGLDLQATEWVLWQGFLAMTLPMLEAIGSDRAVAYLKKLQGELKGKTPRQLWEELHPERDGEGRDPAPEAPEDWRF
jgi:ParB family chromosome partitioning protein